jgi:trypsin
MQLSRLAASVVLTATALAAIASPASGATRADVTGGEAATITDHPWAVALVDQAGHPFCGGTLVAPATVVTTAHCVLCRPTAGITVVGGRTDLGQVTPGDAVSGVSAVASPSGFVAPQRGDDIATLTLATPFPYQPLSPVTDDSAYQPGTVGTVLGWGNLDSDPHDTTTVLHAARVPVLADADCAALFGRYVGGSYDGHAMFCAGLTGQGVGACARDAGDPLLVDGRLAGIVSWTIGCGAHPAFFTRLRSYTRVSAYSLG